MATNSEMTYFETQHRHVRQCLKEARVAVTCWSIGLVYCTTVFVTLGYLPASERPPEPQLVWGLPAWVFWGLFVPWCVQIGLTCWFAMRVLKDDEPYLDFPSTLTGTSPDDPAGRDSQLAADPE